MKVAIYCRVSTRHKGQDVENQLRQLKDFAKKQGWEIVHQFSDHTSGKTSDREQFKNMFSAADEAEVHALLRSSIRLRMRRNDIVWDERNMRWETDATTIGL
jgi:DNA invertase Pin-like site-specific DNA recombinase